MSYAKTVIQQSGRQQVDRIGRTDVAKHLRSLRSDSCLSVMPHGTARTRGARWRTCHSPADAYAVPTRWTGGLATSANGTASATTWLRDEHDTPDCCGTGAAERCVETRRLLHVVGAWLDRMRFDDDREPCSAQRPRASARQHMKVSTDELSRPRAAGRRRL